MSSTDEVTVGKATDEDNDAIVGLGDFYWGKDYLPALIPRVMNDPDVVPVVAKLKGQVVGFMMDHVIDGGTSVIRRGVRTQPTYRNMGIMSAMSRVLNSLTEEKYPNLSHRYQCTGIRDGKLAAESLLHKGFVEVMRKRVLNLVYKTADITGLDGESELPAVLPLECDDLKTLFTLDDLLEQLFPLKRIFNFYIGYMCLGSNIKHFLDDNKEVYATTGIPSQTPYTTKLSRLNDVDVVTFSYWYMAEGGLVYAIDIYAKEGHKEASLEAHVQRHLRVLNELNLCGRGILCISVTENVCQETVLSCLKRCGITDHLPGAEDGKVLLEKRN